MPNIICHTLFLDELYSTLDEEYKEWMEPRKQLMEIGSNGPDILFFHGYDFKRLLKKKEVAHLGGLMHSEKINDFYIKAIECIEKEQNEEIRKDMIAYICGHLCHWALDSNVHPYVFYRTGPCTGQSAWWHHRFESILDAVVLKVKRNCTIEDYRVGSICDASLEMARAIAKIYVPVARDVYDFDLKPHQIVESLHDWNLVQSVFYDPDGKKDQVVRNIEKVLGKENIFSGYIVPNSTVDVYDVCNLMHNRWLHPCDDTIVSTESFFDLYDKSLIVARNAIHLFLDAIDSANGKIDFVHFLQNKNYNLGISSDLEMKYFDTIWE